LNIRVLNLSYGTDSVQDYRRDPLDYAVENAWRAGITVVVSAGNDGTTRAELADPANDPLVVAVGAEDPNNTTGVQDDVIPAFSQRGTDARAVDVIAPGVHLLGLRDPGSFIDQHNPAARAGTRFFRGSGTSQAAAVVSGLAALYLSRFPVATPDQVKDALQHSARIPKLTRKVWTGLGVPDASKLIGYSPVARGIARPGRAAGTGTLDGARGTSRVTDGLSVLTGEQDLFGQPWTATAASGAGTSWTGGSWNGSVWTGSAMAGPVTWGSATWTGSDWNSRTWLDAGWDSRTWLATGWDSRTWLDAGWASTGLQAAAWSAAAWN
jgi:serine protease AprX